MALTQTFEWMAWTVPTAIFFASIAALLVFMTILELVRPSVERCGFLPIATSRGDRLFISLLSAAWIHLGWLGLTDLPLWYGSGVALLWGAVVMRWA
jgi:predicted small integral membrane protein